MKLDAPGIDWVVASGLYPAFVPSAWAQAVIAFTFSLVTGSPSRLSRSVAHCVRSAVGVNDDVAVAVASARADAKSVPVVAPAAAFEAAAGAGGVNACWISAMRAWTAWIPSIGF